MSFFHRLRQDPRSCEMITGLWYSGAKAYIVTKWRLQLLRNHLFCIVNLFWLFSIFEIRIVNCLMNRANNFRILSLQYYINYYISIYLSSINHKFFLCLFSKSFLLYCIILFMKNKKTISHKWIVLLKNDSKIFFKQIKININWI